MEDHSPRPAFGRIKHVLPAHEEELLDALITFRHRYNRRGFVQKRRGGGGASASSGSSSSGSLSSGSSSSGIGSPSSSGGRPAMPNSGSVTGGSSPSKPVSPGLAPPKPPVSAPPNAPKPPVAAPPKAPKSPSPVPPKLPKPAKPYSGGKPSQFSPQGDIPGHSNHHNDVASIQNCEHPKGMDRLRCQKADAVAITVFSIIGLLLLPLLIYCGVKYCKLRWGKGKKIRDEEDGIELTRGVMNCDPRAQTPGTVPSDNPAPVGLAITTSESTFPFTDADEWTLETLSLNSGRGRDTPFADQAKIRDVSRGRRRSRQPAAARSSRDSLSSGMIRIAAFGFALGDPTIIDVPPSLTSSRKSSKAMSSCSDIDRFTDCNADADDEKEEHVFSSDEAIQGSDQSAEDNENGSRSSSSDRNSSPRDPPISPTTLSAHQMRQFKQLS